MRLLFDRMSDTCGETHTAMLKREHFEVRETAVTIITNERFLGVAKNSIFDAREIIERKISEDPFFGTTYDPYPVDKRDHELIQRMCNASVKAHVGPMASVAGAIAVYAVEALRRAGSTHSIVENGGDIALLCDTPVTIGMYSGDPQLEGLSFNILPSKDIQGICSSSGKIGPSVSFGKSDICTVFSSDVILADAVATRLGNMIVDGDVTGSLNSVSSIEGVNGCVAVADGKVAMCGEVPELISAHTSENRITSIRLS